MDSINFDDLGSNQTYSGRVGLTDPIDIHQFNINNVNRFRPSFKAFGAADDLKLYNNDRSILSKFPARWMSPKAINFDESSSEDFLELSQLRGSTNYQLRSHAGNNPNNQKVQDNIDTLTGARETVQNNSDPVLSNRRFSFQRNNSAIGNYNLNRQAYDREIPAGIEVDIDLDLGDPLDKLLNKPKQISGINPADTTNTDRIWEGGELGLNLNGEGLAVGVWESHQNFINNWQIQTKHQEFEGRAIIPNSSTSGKPSDHATRVAGIIGAAGKDPQQKARGMANKVNLYSYNSKNDLDNLENKFNDDPNINKIAVSNHSYEDPVRVKDLYGKYGAETRRLDEILFNKPNLLSVWGAGNMRRERVRYFGGFGYDSLPPKQVAKNTLVVGAIRGIEADPYTKKDVRMSDFSVWGPTDDGRVKPDVVGAGVDIYAPIAYNPLTQGVSNDSYNSQDGTSFAAPNVTGTAVLLIQHYQNLFYEGDRNRKPRSATTKGLLIHTAFDAGGAEDFQKLGNIGPDYVYGWGVVDAAAAANFLTDVAKNPSPTNLLEENTYTGSQSTQKVYSDGKEPLKATIVWTDPAPATLPSSTINDQRVLVNDLDLSITGPDGETYYPWTLDPANPASPAVTTKRNEVDNIEQILIDTPKPGEYTIRVGNTGSITNGKQDYTLLVSGIKTKVSIRASDPDADENKADPGEFTVTRIGPTNKPLTVNYTIDGSASLGQDYDSLSGSVIIPSGETNAKIQVKPINDRDLENRETVELKLNQSDLYDLGSDSVASVIIKDTDQKVSIRASDSAASEGGNPGEFTITRIGSTDNPLTVNYAIGGSASNGGDYLSLIDSVIIPEHETNAKISIIPYDDIIDEELERVELSLFFQYDVNDSYDIDREFSAAAVFIDDNDYHEPDPGSG